MADIIDTAAEIEELQRNAAFPLTASTATPYRLSIVKNAARISQRRGALPFPAARRAPCQSVIELRNKQRGM